MKQFAFGVEQSVITGAPDMKCAKVLRGGKEGLVHRSLRVIVRFALALLLLWTGFLKFRKVDIGPTIYDAWVQDFAILRTAIPMFEGVLAIWLISGWKLKASSITGILMISAFTGISAAEMGKEHPKPCGCMGAEAQLYEPEVIRRELAWSIGRNLLLMGGCIYLVVCSRPTLRAEGAQMTERNLAGK